MQLLKNALQQPAWIVGLTGGIGSGKSTVAAAFNALGVDAINADTCARELTQESGAAMPAIISLFGAAYVLKEGGLNRAKMRDLIFQDNQAKKDLENILHPLIQTAIIAQVALSHSAYIVLEIPLLVENAAYYQEICQRILVVEALEAIRIQRVKMRSQLSEAVILDIIHSQASDAQRRALADDILLNNEDSIYLDQAVLRLHGYYFALAEDFRLSY